MRGNGKIADATSEAVRLEVTLTVTQTDVTRGQLNVARVGTHSAGGGLERFPCHGVDRCGLSRSATATDHQTQVRPRHRNAGVLQDASQDSVSLTSVLLISGLPWRGHGRRG